MTDSPRSIQHEAPSRKRSTLSGALIVVLGLALWVVTAFAVYAVLVYTSA